MDQSFEQLEKAKKECTSKSQNVVIILDMNAKVGNHRYEKQNKKELDHLERRSDRRKSDQQTILNTGTNIVQENCGHGRVLEVTATRYHITIN